MSRKKEVLPLEETLERKLLKAMVTKKLQDWLNDLGRELGEITKEFGIAPKEGKAFILQLLEDSVKFLKTRYEAEHAYSRLARQEKNKKEGRSG